MSPQRTSHRTCLFVSCSFSLMIDCSQGQIQYLAKRGSGTATHAAGLALSFFASFQPNNPPPPRESRGSLWELKAQKQARIPLLSSLLSELCPLPIPSPFSPHLLLLVSSLVFQAGGSSKAGVGNVFGLSAKTPAPSTWKILAY